VNRREQAMPRAVKAPASEKASATDQTATDQPLSKSGGFQLVASNRYLRLIALLVLVFSLVNTLGGFILNSMITAEAGGDRALIGRMAGQIQTWVNLVSFLMQAFVVSRIFKYAGVRVALFILPVIALGGYTMIALLPIFAVVRWTKILENSADYSIQNTTRHALFLPTSREAKYKAKQAIDSFFVRAGDLLQAAVVFIGTMLAFGVRSYAVVNIVLVAIWIGLAVAIAREHRALVPADVEKAA
jgi:AAA family ATP:ADP antiporter